MFGTGEAEALGIVLIRLDGPQKLKQNQTKHKPTQMLGVLKQRLENKAQNISERSKKPTPWILLIVLVLPVPKGCSRTGKKFRERR